MRCWVLVRVFLSCCVSGCDERLGESSCVRLDEFGETLEERLGDRLGELLRKSFGEILCKRLNEMLDLTCI